jgi:hypothetical protein
VSALDMLEYWKIVKTNYTEHNPSVTITVKDNEWIQVMNWVYDNFDLKGGLSFLPESHLYKLAPYEEITKDEYEKMKITQIDPDFSKLIYYEKTDNTEMKRQMACSGDKCEL